MIVFSRDRCCVERRLVDVNGLYILVNLLIQNLLFPRVQYKIEFRQRDNKLSFFEHNVIVIITTMNRSSSDILTSIQIYQSQFCDKSFFDSNWILSQRKYKFTVDHSLVFYFWYLLKYYWCIIFGELWDWWISLWIRISFCLLHKLVWNTITDSRLHEHIDSLLNGTYTRNVIS